MGNTTLATARFGTVITAIGAAKLTASVLHGTKVAIVQAAVGDGGGAPYKPTPEQTGLRRVCWRGEIASARVNEDVPNMIDVKFVVPAEVGGFTVREAALIDADGDAIAICNTPDAEKVAVADGVSFPLTMVMHIVVSDASVVSFAVNPALDTVSREELRQALDAHSRQVGSALIREITLPAGGWAAFSSAEQGAYSYKIDVAIDGCTEQHFPVMAFSIASEDAAAAAEISRSADACDGYVRFYAKTAPAQDLTGTVQLRSENLLNPDAGGGMGDSGAATDAEVSDMITGIFG